MKELLLKCRRLCLTSNSTNEFTKENRVELIKEIDTELEKPKQKPLSDDEIDSIKFYSIPSDFDASLRRFARAIEKAHGIGEL